MATRTYHGITDVEFGTASALSTDGDGTSIANIIAEAGAEGGENSRIEFLDEEGNPIVSRGNQLAGVDYVRFIIHAADPTNMATIRTNWKADTKQFFAADLDNDQRVHTTVAVLLEYCRPANIMGRKQGRADVWEFAFRIPYEDVSFSA